VSGRVGIVTRPPTAAWRGPLRAWLEQRARELRDEPAVRDVQIVAWTRVIEFAHPFGAEPIVRDVLADLETLDASPELTDVTAG
jgi:hypothetical protein